MKQIDRNGFWQIKDNPISKVGIFPYLGKQIDDSLEPNKVYMVLRPEEELFNPEALESFNGVPVPLINEHTMLGEEYTPAEKKGVAGVVTNIRREGDTLTGDISIYSEDMKEKITNGKKELSLGYFCSYDLTAGVFNGQKYDAIQRDIRSNHIALVDRGRCGSDVRVFDKWSFDCAIEKVEEKQTEGETMITTVFDQLSILKAVIDEQLALFKEEDHPRAKNGQFASKGQGGSGGGSSKAAAIKQTGGNSSNAGGAGATQAKKKTGKQESKLPTKPLDQTKAWKGWLAEGVRVGDYYNGLKDGDRKKQAEEACRLIELCEGDNKQHLENLIAEKGLNGAKLFLMKALKPFKEEGYRLYCKPRFTIPAEEREEDEKHSRLVGGTEHSINKAIEDIKGRIFKEKWEKDKEREAAANKEESKPQQTETQKQESLSLEEKEKQFVENYKKEKSKEKKKSEEVSARGFKEDAKKYNSYIDGIKEPDKRKAAEKAREIFNKFKGDKEINTDLLKKMVAEKGEEKAIGEVMDLRRQLLEEAKNFPGMGNGNYGIREYAIGEAMRALSKSAYEIRGFKHENKTPIKEKQELPQYYKDHTKKMAEFSRHCLKVLNDRPDYYKAYTEKDLLKRADDLTGNISKMEAIVKLHIDNEDTKQQSEAFKILTDLKEVKSRLKKGASLLKNKNSQDAAIKCLRNTTSNSGLTASTDANINQSKLEELKKMIDKDKLLALKELVQMLEGEATTPEATADKDEDSDKDNDLDLLDEEGKEESEDADTEEAEKLDFEDSKEEDKEEAEDADTDESLIDLKDDEDNKKKEKKSEDELPSKIFKMLADRDSLVKKVKPIIGNFDFQKMTVDQVAKYACDKLDIETSNPREAINGYLKGYKRSSTYSLDSGIKEQSTTQSQIEAYLKGSK